MQYICEYQSPLGGMTMASDGEALTGLWFDRQKYFGAILPTKTEKKALPVFEQTKHWLSLYFRGEIPDFTPLLALHATPFRLAVWQILRNIPHGQVTTYGAIAAAIAKQQGLKRMSAQAVGGAVGHNPISILVPCHRVVGSNGSLTGYAAGIDKKIQLLTMEKTDMQRLSIPKKGAAL